MEKATTNIKDPKVRAYFDDVTEGKKLAVQLTAEEYEQGINEFDDGMRKIIAEADEMIFRAKLGDLPEALSFSYIAQKYFGKSRGWLMQKVNGNKVNSEQKDDCCGNDFVSHTHSNRVTVLLLHKESEKIIAHKNIH